VKKGLVSDSRFFDETSSVWHLADTLVPVLSLQFVGDWGFHYETVPACFQVDRHQVLLVVGYEKRSVQKMWN
jgi:hypothetical protein